MALVFFMKHNVCRMYLFYSAATLSPTDLHHGFIMKDPHTMVFTLLSHTRPPPRTPHVFSLSQAFWPPVWRDVSY